MESHEVMRDCIHDRGVKTVAGEMRLSSSLVYKWCQAREDAAGADNPLDRIQRIVEVTSNQAPIHWLCQKFDGFFVSNPKSKGQAGAEPVLMATQSLLREFSDMLAEVSKSLMDDNFINDQEAVNIRREWEELKSLAESFVRTCEAGHYGQNHSS